MQVAPDITGKVRGGDFNNI